MIAYTPALHHLQNEDFGNCIRWWWQGELEGHAIRKAYLWLKYEPDTVTVGPPCATRWYTVEQLQDRGIIGLYVRRKGGVRAWLQRKYANILRTMRIRHGVTIWHGSSPTVRSGQMDRS